MKDGAGSVQSVLVLGGGSDLGLATVRALVRGRTRDVVLAARKPERLEPVAAKLRDLGTRVDLVEFDADALETHVDFVARVFQRHTDIDVVVLAFGVLGDQVVDERNSAKAVAVAHTNYMGAVSVLIPVAEKLRTQGHGTIIVLSSVAAERPRRSNFVYGSSKAGLDAFATGLGDALAGTGVKVMVVRPGFVHTKMTAGRAVKPLAATTEQVAGAIVAGIRRGAEVVWVPPTLRFVMSGLRHLPRSVFRRLNL